MMARGGEGRAGLAGLAGLVLVALALRVPYLDAAPSPANDEGNWAWIAFDLREGRPAALAPDARFVTLAFARMIAAAYGALGVSFASARAVCVAGVLLGMLAAYGACAAMGARRAGLCVAGVLAVHPWSVLWSRTVTVPYALSLAAAVAGPLAYLAALRARAGPRRGLGLAAAACALFGAAHFSPLAAVPLAACALWTLARREHRRVLRAPSFYGALALGALVALPVARGALEVAGRGDGRPRRFFTSLGARLYTYFRTLLDGLSGEATVRHFTGDVLPAVGEAGAVLVVVALVALAARAGSDAGERGEAREAGAASGPGGVARELRGFALAYLGVAVVGLPVLLAPARPWNLPAVDAERYVFVVLAPFALLLGALAAGAGGKRACAWAFVLYLLAGPTARIAWGLLAGGSADRGFYLLPGGGGYRGWKVPRERVAVPALVRDAVLADARGEPATILVADYAFHTLHVANARGGVPTVDVLKFPMPVRPGHRFYVVLWSEGLFAPGYYPALEVDANAALGRRLREEFDGVRLVRRVVQANGAPLLEVWTGVQRAGARGTRVVE